MVGYCNMPFLSETVISQKHRKMSFLTQTLQHRWKHILIWHFYKARQRDQNQHAVVLRMYGMPYYLKFLTIITKQQINRKVKVYSMHAIIFDCEMNHNRLLDIYMFRSANNEPITIQFDLFHICTVCIQGKYLYT